MAVSMSLDYLSEGAVGGSAAPLPLGGRGGRNKYAVERRFSDTAAFSGRSFTLDEDGLVRFLCSSRLEVRKESSGMDDRDKRIYNSLGDSSGPKGKMTSSELQLDRGCQKRGIMFKSGPNPSWYARWKKRVFILKGNVELPDISLCDSQRAKNVNC
ncbi:hypothetical protein GBAR_LOCUS9658 [Geodia barretti]|uniref:Uncharacterized protein n=1 Tax=Geodia barretti TaxID=519541 RepID=A0AA35WJ39_GEOBA|nr:hypothetical protein GBAR_LOCUS9658 [Geodia barretti]